MRCSFLVWCCCWEQQIGSRPLSLGFRDLQLQTLYEHYGRDWIQLVLKDHNGRIAGEWEHFQQTETKHVWLFFAGSQVSEGTWEWYLTIWRYSSSDEVRKGLCTWEVERIMKEKVWACKIDQHILINSLSDHRSGIQSWQIHQFCEFTLMISWPSILIWNSSVFIFFLFERNNIQFVLLTLSECLNQASTLINSVFAVSWRVGRFLCEVNRLYRQ